jgi:large subunit ribosomal protein L25
VSEVRITAEPRSEFGKGAARRIRRDHRVPAVLYGHGGEPRHISLPGHELMLALKTQNVLLNITLDGKSELALPKDVQRDPVRGFLEHVDLLVVRRGEKVKVDVALHVVGTQAPDSVLMTELNSLEVLAEATHIPTSFEVDISGRPIGSQIHAKEVELPPGVELLTDPEALVVNIAHSRTDEAPDATEAAASGEGQAPAAGDDGQPAAE